VSGRDASLTSGKLPAAHAEAKHLRILWRVVLWLAPLAVGAVLLTYRLEDVAGLFRDEAAVGLFAEWIIAGLRPTHGYFNDYTAPMHSYMIACVFAFFGESITSLRASGVLTSLMAAGVYGDFVRRVAPDRALWSLWFLVTLPAFVVFSRIAAEHYALNPLFLVSAAWSYQAWANQSSVALSRRGYFCAGLLLVLGIWNHLVFLPSAVALVVACVVASKKELRPKFTLLPWFVAGTLLGAAPKIYGMWRNNDALVTLTNHLGKPDDFLSAVWNFVYGLGGDGLFARMCGEVILSLNWVLPVAALLSLFVHYATRLAGDRRRLSTGILLFIALSFVGTWAMTPHFKLDARVWQLSMWGVPLLMALALPQSPTWLRRAIGTLIVCANLVAIGMNYFYGFLTTGGATGKVYVGGRVMPCSDFMDVRPVVRKFERTRGVPLYLHDITLHRIEFLLPRAERARSRPFPLLLTPETAFEQHSLIALRRDVVARAPHTFRLGASGLERVEALGTRHFFVYRVVVDRLPQTAAASANGDAK